ncbi:MAG: ferredoxin--NADP reductase [Candidatus Woesearchaeota archaeon]
MRILEINRETSDTVTVTVTKPSGFQYRSGQYVMIGIGRTVNGKKNIPITFASSPTEDKLRFTIKNYGGYSNDLINSRIGDSWIISKPMGEAYNFDESHTENLVFLSAGSGITPFISIMRYIRSKGMNNKIIMLNGNCKYEDIIYRTELDFLSKDNIYIMNTLEKFDDSWRGEKGRITKDMILKYVNSERLNDYAWMICGPPLMVNSLEKDLKSLGVKDVRRDKWEIPGRCER